MAPALHTVSITSKSFRGTQTSQINLHSRIFLCFELTHVLNIVTLETMEGIRKRQHQEEVDLPEGIIVGKKYRLEIRNSPPGLVGLHFSFKPADVDTSVESKLIMNASKGEASVTIKRQNKSEIETYKGDAAKDKSFALAFNQSTSSFSIQKVDLMVNQLKFKERIVDE